MSLGGIVVFIELVRNGREFVKKIIRKNDDLYWFCCHLLSIAVDLMRAFHFSSNYELFAR